MSVPLHLRCASLTETGRRAKNDDCVFADDKSGVYAVFDGASARIGGRTAAELACQAFAEASPSVGRKLGGRIGPEAPKLAEEMLQSAHQRILQAQAGDATLAGMTTTVVLLIHREGEVLVSHVGDSRSYLYRAPELRLLTRDHSLENYLKDNPEVRPRVKRPGKTLVRALGLRSSKLGAEHRRVELANDDLLLLCSDGLTDSVPSWTIRAVLDGLSCASMRETSRALVRCALSHGSMDNVSVLVLHAAARAAVTARTVMYEVDAAGPDSNQHAGILLGWLTFLEGSQRGAVIPLEGSTVIGADADCAVSMHEEYVSSRHAEILRGEYGFVLRDLGSTNGTFVNDTKITQVDLVDGDVVRIGNAPVVFKSHHLER